MKRFILLIILISISTIGFGQGGEFYYWYKGEKQPLQLKPDKNFLLLDHQTDEKSLSDKLQVDITNIERIRKVELGASYKQSHTQLRNNYWTTVKTREEQMDLTKPGIIYYAPFFQGSRGEEVGLSHLFYVKLHHQEDREQLEALAKQHHVEILYNNKFRPLWYTLACDRNSTGNALELANLFYEMDLFAASEPDLMPTALF